MSIKELREELDSRFKEMSKSQEHQVVLLTDLIVKLSSIEKILLKNGTILEEDLQKELEETGRAIAGMVHLAFENEAKKMVQI